MKAGYAIGVLCIALLAACGSEQDTSSSSQTSPAPPNAIKYRLIAAQDLVNSDGSSISFRRPGSGHPPIFQPLDGTFEVVPQPVEPNRIFSFTITRIAFHSRSYTVAGSTGVIAATTLHGLEPLSVFAPVTINEQPIDLMGTGSFDTFTTDSPRSFHAVVLLGAGYGLTIFAEPEG